MISARWRTPASCLSRSSPKLRGSFPAGKTGGIAALTAQQASAMCSHVADTPAAASRRKMATTRDHEGTPEMNTRPNIVLVHGAWADGSCWSAVIERLQADGYHVTAPQFPLTALADDVARLRQVLDRQDGPAIVAGHSYGGQVMTALGADAPNVAGLVYVAAFGLDQGESLGALLSQGPVTPALAHLVTDQQGFGWLSEDDFVSHFAADVDPVRAKVMYAVQQPLAASAFGDVMGVPAWKTLPSWYLVAADDQAIPPEAERQFAARMGATTVEIPSSHVPMVSHPGEVAQLIKTAAEAVLARS
jgi:pimeloyl-ACP methyl ester carboxylesterase